MMITRTKPTAKDLLEQILCLGVVEREIGWHFKKAFTDLVVERPVTPVEILCDGEIASNLAQGLFNDGTDTMGKLSENGLKLKDVLRVAKAILQMSCEM